MTHDELVAKHGLDELRKPDESNEELIIRVFDVIADYVENDLGALDAFVIAGRLADT